MHYRSETLSLTTTAAIDRVDITPSVRRFVEASRLDNGLLTVTSQHTTAYININEQEYRLTQDMLEFLQRWVPRDDDYGHNRDTVDGRANAHAHLIGLCMSASQSLPVINGELVLGRWQSIFFIELDGPRAARQVVLHIMGE